MTSAIQNGGSYYTIGYTPELNQLNGQYRNIKLKLDNASYDLAYRRGYYVMMGPCPMKRQPADCLLCSGLLLEQTLEHACLYLEILILVRTNDDNKELRFIIFAANRVNVGKPEAG
jgi:hypothetical protein